MESGSGGDMNVIRPPLVRSAATSLNRSLFSKTLNLAAAAVKDSRNIAKYRKALDRGNEILRLERISNVVPDPDGGLAAQGRKCVLLRHGVIAGAPETWGPVLNNGVKQDELGVIPYELKLDYDYWDYHDIMSSILPKELHSDIPSGFNTVGHVAHLNLREQHLPYKSIIGEVLLDKNPQIRTVINKTDNVGTESAYRTFNYEVLAGPDDLNVEVREGGCVFHFDYSKVYWNSKLETEHRRIINLFRPGEVVCDVMAGIGPFAVPAGKKGVFVWANDMNPDSYFYLKKAVEKNKVTQYVRPFNEDGRTFIAHAVQSVLAASANGEGAMTISHFVMNLPASAITFLHQYRGIYASYETLFAPHTAARLPLVHVHCFGVKSGDDGDGSGISAAASADICERISAELGVTMRPGHEENDLEVAIYDVRDVAPSKCMFCASFRLPAEVAFASGQ